ncbi:MAG: MerR family transcriptional regulator [Telluria sp.]|nr:MerR family transcriptional regulator [Telluria sp.]
MNIGTLAKETGLAQSRIRFYEAQGLLGEVRRTANGYRVYAPETGHILGIIRSAQDAGFSLDEIRHFLPQADGAGWDCARIAASLKAKLADIAVIQARLARTRGELETLLARIERGDPDDACFKGATSR